MVKMFVLLSTSSLVTVAQHYTPPLLCTCTSQIYDPSVLITGKTDCQKNGWTFKSHKYYLKAFHHFVI